MHPGKDRRRVSPWRALPAVTLQTNGAPVDNIPPGRYWFQHMTNKRSRLKDEHGLTPLERRYALGLLAGMKPVDALKESRPETTAAHNTLKVEASRMAARPHVAAFIRNTRDAAAERATVTLERVLKELAAIGFSNVADFLGPDGHMVIDPRHLTRTQAAGLGAEITVDMLPPSATDETPPSDTNSDSTGAPTTTTRVKFKTLDKRAALMDIVGIMGWGFKGAGRAPGAVVESSSDNLDVVRRVAFILDQQASLSNGSEVLDIVPEKILGEDSEDLEILYGGPAGGSMSDGF